MCGFCCADSCCLAAGLLRWRGRSSTAAAAIISTATTASTDPAPAPSALSRTTATLAAARLRILLLWCFRCRSAALLSVVAAAACRLRLVRVRRLRDGVCAARAELPARVAAAVAAAAAVEVVAAAVAPASREHHRDRVAAACLGALPIAAPLRLLTSLRAGGAAAAGVRDDLPCVTFRCAARTPAPSSACTGVPARPASHAAGRVRNRGTASILRGRCDCSSRR